MPERVIDHIMRALQIPEDQWMGYFTREIVRLHGWAGFIRWRASASHYYWAKCYPGDLVDLLAIRLTLAWVLLNKPARGRLPKTTSDLQRLIEERPQETYLRLEMNSGQVLPALAHRVDTCLARAKHGKSSTPSTTMSTPGGPRTHDCWQQPCEYSRQNR